MILVDTSVWINHFRSENLQLSQLILADQVLSHPFVIGELSLGQLKNRNMILEDLHGLEAASQASDAEVLGVIDRFQLAGRGIGYIDAHLLASALLTGRTRIWSHDKRMSAAASSMSIAANPPFSR